MKFCEKANSSASAAAAQPAPVSAAAKVPCKIMSQLKYPSGAPQFNGTTRTLLVV